MSQDKISRVGINTLSVIAGRTLNLLIQLFVSIAIANYLGDYRYGQFNLALTFIGFFDILVNFGTTQITIREIVSHPKQTNTIVGSVLTLRCTLLLISIGLGSLIATSLNYDDIEIILILIFFSNFLFSTRLASVRKTLESPFEAQLQMLLVTLLQIIDSIILLIATLLAIQKNASLLQLALVYTLSNAPGTIIIAIWGLRKYRILPKFSSTKIQHLLLLGFPVMLFRLFSNINTRMDVLVVDYFRGSSEVGLYSAATRLIYPLFFVASSLSVSFLPLLTSYHRSRNSNFKTLFLLGIKLLDHCRIKRPGCIIYFKKLVDHPKSLYR
ncbi:MAG: oligosaccharide flippase family protein [candidate division KSB1 bacterium]|nr:oligosaccharide flippase family protein [candidate division KSB1 bacterium]